MQASLRYLLLLAGLAAGTLAAPAAKPTPAVEPPAAAEPTAPAATPEPAAAEQPATATADPTAKDGKKKNKDKNKDGSNKDKKKKDKNKDGDKDKDKDKDKAKDGGKDKKKDKKKDKDKTDAKGVIDAPAEEPAKSANGDWCEWLSKDPGLLYDNKKNPWIQAFKIGGRFQYQAAYQDGSDMYDRNYHDNYDEYRRLRFETQTKFLRYFTATMDVNLVADDRFKNPPDNDLHWGYDDFDTATLEFNLGKALGTEALDSLKLTYGKMKMPITEEQRQSSKSIYTIERSMLSDKLVGDESRPTGFTVELGKDDWSGTLGIYSGEDDADFIGGWNDGITQFYSLTWQPDKDFHLTLDYVTTHQSGTDDALGYRSAVVLGSTYEKKRWGLQSSLMYGDNGYGDLTDNARNRARRQGDFFGVTVMPWYWLAKDRLQLVCRYEHAGAEDPEGLQLSSRYIRGHHDDPLVDVSNGRGDRYDALYLGLNYYLCGDNAKIMAGVQYENLGANSNRKVERKNKLGGDYYVNDTGTVEAFTYMIAFRTSF